MLATALLCPLHSFRIINSLLGELDDWQENTNIPLRDTVISEISYSDLIFIISIPSYFFLSIRSESGHPECMTGPVSARNPCQLLKRAFGDMEAEKRSMQ